VAARERRFAPGASYGAVSDRVVPVDNAPRNGGKAIEVVEKNGVHDGPNREQSGKSRGGIRLRLVRPTRDR